MTEPSEFTIPGQPGLNLVVTLTRLEAKLDVALAQHTAKLERHGSEIADLRATVQKIEDRPIASPDGVLDHETRLRHIENERLPMIEARAVVTPRAMWAGIATLTGIVGTAAALAGVFIH